LLSKTNESKYPTKGEILGQLSHAVENAEFVDQLLFSVADWQKNRSNLLDKIKNTFSSDMVVVRSSAVNEDHWATSSAGKYLSVIGIKPNSTEIETAVNEVIESYQADDGDNQILVQPQLRNVALSGVLMSRDLNTGAPYWIINYDDLTGRTDTVTSGIENKAIRILRGNTEYLHSAIKGSPFYYRDILAERRIIGD